MQIFRGSVQKINELKKNNLFGRSGGVADGLADDAFCVRLPWR
jgi:hypothetical protein